MRRIAVFVVTVLTLNITSAFSMDYGTAHSLDELLATRWRLRQKVKDYNSTRDPNGSLWKGVFCFCVCRHDRGRIIWVSDLTFDVSDGGSVLSRLRQHAEKCGGCFSPNPKLEFIEP